MSRSTVQDDKDPPNDPKYRIFTREIDKALKAFEGTSRWPDLIYALGRLIKVLESNNKYQTIPQRLLVGQRLAQCLHPELPSGVHLKALETYDLIFRIIGSDKLVQELSIYSNGLFPLFSTASIEVKPELLKVFTNHFVPLGERLRPALDGLLIAILLDLEDGSEHYSTTDALLKSLCDKVGKKVFYTSLWQGVLIDSDVRLPAITFVTSHFVKKKDAEEQKCIMGNNLNVFIGAICASLLDSNILVQRAVLDLLLECFPMNNNIILLSDMISITTAAITALLRRDVSLNRRLDTWLFGFDSNVQVIKTSNSNKSKRKSTGSFLSSRIKERRENFFMTNSKHLVLKALIVCLGNPEKLIPIPNSWSSLGDNWVYSLLICLLDHEEISRPIFDSICLDMFRSLYKDFKCDKIHTDLMKTCDLLLANLGVKYLWQRLHDLLVKSCETTKLQRPNGYTEEIENEEGEHVKKVGTKEITISEVFTLMDFMVDAIPAENNPETETLFLPSALNYILRYLIEYCSLYTCNELDLGIKLCSKIVQKIKSNLQSNEVNIFEEKNQKLSDIKEENESLISDDIKNTESIDVKNDQMCETSYVDQLVSSIEKLFSLFVRTRLIKNNTVIDEYYKNFLLDNQESDSSYAWPLLYLNSNMIKVYKNLTSLLVKTAIVPLPKDAIPVCSAEYKCSQLKDWLVCLLTLSCFATEEKFVVSYCSISTLLDLVCILKSAINDSPFVGNLLGGVSCSSPILNFSDYKKVETDYTIKKLLPFSSFHFIHNQSKYFIKITQLLWTNLRDELSDMHLETSILLQQTHNLAEDSSVCESVIIFAMSSSEDEVQSYEAKRRFCNLFTITRDLRQKSSLFTFMREFDRPLFFMLDSLTHKIDSHSALAFDWLSQCLKEGDVARLLEPLLFILLHPDTNRVSVQHVNIHQPEVPQDAGRSDEADNAAIAAAEAKIYAISSTGGNLIYHIYPEGKKRFVSPSSQKVLTLTSQNHVGSKSPGKTITSKFHLPDYEVPYCDALGATGKHTPINVFLNPFGSLSSLASEATDSLDATVETAHADFTNARRIDLKSLIKSYDEARRTPTPISTSLSLSFHSKEEPEHSSDFEVVANLLDELIDNVVARMDDEIADDGSSGTSGTTRQTMSESVSLASCIKPISVNHLHSHLLLYTQVYDSRRTLFALNTLWSVIITEPQVVLLKMATTSISNRLGNRSSELQKICARHCKSILGLGYYSPLDEESITAFKSNSFLEVIVTACLYYIRSFYPSLPQSRLNDEEIQGNQKVRILSCEILRLIFSELVNVVKSIPNLPGYLNEMLLRCKVQKMILHSVVSSVYNFSLDNNIGNKDRDEDNFPDTILDFNEKMGSIGFQEDMQKSILKLLEQLVILEAKVSPSTNEKELPTHNRKDSDSRAARIRFQPQFSELKYSPNVLIPSQAMFFCAIQAALQQSHKANLHCNWLALVEATLPYANKSLSRLVTSVILQLCHNLSHISEQIEAFKNTKKITNTSLMPPNYLNVLLISLKKLAHFCLVDSTNSNSTQQLSISTTNSSGHSSSTGPLQVLSNLFNVFSSVDGMSEMNNSIENGSSNGDPLLSSRRAVLNQLYRIIPALLQLWKVVNESNDVLGWQVMGTPDDVKKNIISLLEPIPLLNGCEFMSSVGTVWYNLRDTSMRIDRRSVVPPVSPSQKLLVDLVASVRVFPMESVLEKVRQVFKQPLVSSKKKRSIPEVSMLQFLLAYIKVTPISQLLESWKSLLALLKDSLQVSRDSPMAQFHLLAILHEFVQAAPLFEDRKDQKDLQDVAHKLVEACTSVAAARLAQPRWSRKGLEVKPGPQNCSVEDTESDFKEPSILKVDTVISSNDNADNDSDNLAKYSVQALNALAQFVAPVLDVVYVSEEKEKVIPLVSSIISYVTPYLKNHSKQNFPSFRACSHLLSSISGYQYSRRAWRKDAFELLLDNSFFQMEPTCLVYWKTIIDHLMTHDKTSFRDFLNKMSVNQTGSLKIFSSKDQETEQRAQLAKRLAFILFCSEKDQYQRYMAEIQEKLIEALRINTSPILQSNILLCFRVLIMRMSPHYLTSLWPFIYTEMCQIFLRMESELIAENNETRRSASSFSSILRLNSEKDTSSNNGSTNCQLGYNHLYLQAAKLLDLALTLPSDSLPQFQMYKWAFINNYTDNEVKECDDIDLINVSSNITLEPFISRIEKYMRSRNQEPELLPSHPKCPLLMKTSINDILDLHPFFYTLLKRKYLFDNFPRISYENDEIKNMYCEENTSELDELSYIDKIFEVDFLEPIPN